MSGRTDTGVFHCLAEVTVVNKRGLHARASAAFVKCVEKFDAEVTVTKDGQSVSGASIMGLMMLAAAPGSTIIIETDGQDADQAMEALTTLIEKGFYEKE